MKERLDILLVDRGFVASRERAKAAIMEGRVYIGGLRFDKPGTKVDVDSPLEVRGDDCPYVGRGGLKLKKAIDVFGLSLEGLDCMDMGASTGGFTDCMLQEGAKHVYAVDVGYGQLDYRLRQDQRVTVMERTNIRYMDTDLIKPRCDFASIDVSFISTRHMFPVANQVLHQQASIVSLVKPQFEAGREQVGKGGIVRDPAVHQTVIGQVIGYAMENGFCPYGLTYSPITGAKGNIEYLLYLKRPAAEEEASQDYGTVTQEDIATCVAEAFGALKE